MNIQTPVAPTDAPAPLSPAQSRAAAVKSRGVGMLDSLLMNVRVAFVALRTNMMRSVLTTLGIIIGVMSVILTVAVGNGAKQQVLDSVNSLGTNMAIIWPVPDGGGRTVANSGRLTLRDAEAIRRSIDGVTLMAPQLRIGVQAVAGAANANTSLIGMTPDYAALTNTQVRDGRMIGPEDMRTAARVIVIGATVARKLFGNADPIGQTVRVNRVPMLVVGLLESKGDGVGGDQDDLILTPISTARQRLGGLNLVSPDSVHVLFIQFQEGLSVEDSREDLKRVLRARYNVRTGDVDPFTIRTTEEFIRESQNITGIFQMILVAIASISLLVGGIGIMNIMLVSVTERTREIGLRMALGARKTDIQNQFLVESAVLCVIGGAIGIAIGLLCAQVFTHYTGWPAFVGAPIVALAVAFSALIGIVFGFLPARRAARMNPIEALRHE
jgi:putative ABC transport system permease protein